jgi:hypothetical protein
MIDTQSLLSSSLKNGEPEKRRSDNACSPVGAPTFAVCSTALSSSTSVTQSIDLTYVAGFGWHILLPDPSRNYEAIRRLKSADVIAICRTTRHTPRLHNPDTIRIVSAPLIECRHLVPLMTFCVPVFCHIDDRIPIRL